MQLSLGIREFIDANDKDRRLQILRGIKENGPSSALEFSQGIGASDDKEIKTVGRVFAYLRDNKLLEWHRNESFAVVANRCQLTIKAKDLLANTPAVKPSNRKSAAVHTVKASSEIMPAFITLVSAAPEILPEPQIVKEAAHTSRPKKTTRADEPVVTATPPAAPPLPGYLPTSLIAPESFALRRALFAQYLAEPKTAGELAVILGLSVKTTSRLLQVGLNDNTILGSDDEEQRFVIATTPVVAEAPVGPSQPVIAEEPASALAPIESTKPAEPVVQVIPARRRRGHRVDRSASEDDDVEIRAELEAFMQQPAMILHRDQVARSLEHAPIEDAPVDNAPALSFLSSLGATVARLRAATGSPMNLKDRDDLQEQFSKFFTMAHFPALVMPRTLLEYVKMSKLADEVATKVVELAVMFGIVEPTVGDTAAVKKFRLKGVYRNLPASDAVRTALQRIDGARTAGNRRGRKKTVWISGSAAARAFAR